MIRTIVGILMLLSFAVQTNAQTQYKVGNKLKIWLPQAPIPMSDSSTTFYQARDSAHMYLISISELPENEQGNPKEIWETFLQLVRRSREQPGQRIVSDVPTVQDGFHGFELHARTATVTGDSLKTWRKILLVNAAAIVVSVGQEADREEEEVKNRVFNSLEVTVSQNAELSPGPGVLEENPELSGEPSEFPWLYLAIGGAFVVLLVLLAVRRR